MAIPTIFDICEPRPDILALENNQASYAADLAQTLAGLGPEGYRDPAAFFANTYPTRGIKNLLQNVFSRLSGKGHAASAIFHLDTNYGGGKTHALISLAHAAENFGRIHNLAEFLDPELLPAMPVRIAAFDGENADPANGRILAPGLAAHTPWGELAFALAGPAGFERVAESDKKGVAPGSDTLASLMGNNPCLILIDEPGVYLRKASGLSANAPKQMTAFLTSLFKAVESRPHTSLVYTLALGKGGADAYKHENEILGDVWRELQSVSARKATPLNPTENDETVKVLRRRLFKHIDDNKARLVINEYIRLWNENAERVPQTCRLEETRQNFRLGYPLHPELMTMLTEKTATLADFQRVRGMLRILGLAVKRLWQEKPAGVYAIHGSNIDLKQEGIRQEITTRLHYGNLEPALKADVASVGNEAPALAERLDKDFYSGLAPYHTALGRVVLLHTLAFNDSLKGITHEGLRYALLSPGMDQTSLIDDAARHFQEQSAYLDDKAGAPLRFSHQANLNLVIRQFSERIDKNASHALIRERAGNIFSGNMAETVIFPGMASEAPDNSTKMTAVVLNYDSNAVTMPEEAPDLAKEIWQHTANDKPRLNLNYIAFIAANAKGIDQMLAASRRYLGLKELKNSQIYKDLPPDQKNRIDKDLFDAGKQVDTIIQQTFRHVYYPYRDVGSNEPATLTHAAMEPPVGATKPGSGELAFIATLAKKKLKTDDLGPVSYLIDRTALSRGPASIRAIWNDFCQNPALSSLLTPSVLLRGIEQGIRQGSLVYAKGDLVWAKGQPTAMLELTDQDMIYTIEQARDSGVWPRIDLKKTDFVDLVEKTSLKNAPAGLADIQAEYNALPKGQNAPAFEENLASQIKNGKLVYKDGPIIWAENEPKPEALNPAATLFTAEQAKIARIWPKVVDPTPAGEIKLESGLKNEILPEIFKDLAEKKKNAGITRITRLVFEISQANIGFAILRIAASLPKCQKQINFEASWEAGGGEVSCAYNNGDCATASEIGSWLAAQLRASQNTLFSMTIDLQFTENPDLEEIATRLCKAGPYNATTMLFGVEE